MTMPDTETVPAGCGRILYQAVRASPAPFIQMLKRMVSVPDDAQPELLTLAQAAAHLNITDEQVTAFVQDGTLPFINVGRGSKRPRYRFVRSDLDTFIEHRRQREAQCPSTNPNSRRSTHSTSVTVVSDFMGPTGCTTRKKAEAFEAVRHKKAVAEMEAMAKARASMLINDVCARLWDLGAQHDAEPKATSANFARLITYFGKNTPLTDIDLEWCKRMVAWRRGHRIKCRKDAPLITPATVNRSTTRVLQRIFAFAKDEGAVFEKEPKWAKLLLDEPDERVRELHDHEADALDANMRDDYAPFFAFALATGLRQRECVTLRWPEVNFGTQWINRTGKGGRAVRFPISPTVREILFPLQGQHPDFVFTYTARRTDKRRGLVRGKRYPLTISGAKSVWTRMRTQAGIKGFRFHDFRHDFATKFLRATGNLKLTQKALNHADIASTMKYAHVLDEDVAPAVELVAQSRRKSPPRIRRAS